jgi:Cu-Zn family superoxide dismutase
MTRPVEVSARVALVGLLVVAGMAGCRESTSGRTFTVTMHHISAAGIGDVAGTLTFAETPDGLLVTPNLRGFRPGFHAFHAHEVGDCGPAIGESGRMESGRAAGPHYNGPAGQAAPAPAPSMPVVDDGMKMEGMSADGMKMEGMATPTTRMPMRGDMPQLTADADGTITKPVLKTGLPLDEILGRSVMMHPYGEVGMDPERPNDDSATVRIACALLPKGA